MKVRLLGGVGYIGGRLVQFLESRGHDVRVSTRRALEDVPAWVSRDRAVQLDPSLAQASALSAFLDDSDVLIHLAAPDQAEASRDPPAALRAGAVTTWLIMDAVARQARPPAVIYLSTFHVYGPGLSGTVTETTPPNPVHPYALGKRFGEEVVQLFRRQKGLNGLVVRLSNAFGYPAGAEISQWSLVFNDLCRQAATERRIVLRTAGTDVRNFITLSDAVRALEHLALHRQLWPPDGIIHVGSAIALTIREVAELVAERTHATLGFRPAIEVPAEAGSRRPAAFSFSTERLAETGFTWVGDVEREVDATLQLCAEARPRA